MKNTFDSRDRIRQNGFTLIEMAFLLAFLGLVMIAVSKGMIDSAKQIKANKFGDEAKVVLNSVNTYTANNFSSLINGVPISGVPSPLAPTFQQLQAIGAIPASMSQTNSMGSGWNISLSKTPAGCGPSPAAVCDIAVFINTTGAILSSNGAPDTSILAQVMSRVGKVGGMSSIDSPSIISGQDAIWTQPNPLGNVAGVFGMEGGSGTSAYDKQFSQIVRMGSTQNVALNGNLSVAGSGGMSIAGAGGLNTTKMAATVAITAPVATIATLNGTTFNGTTFNSTTMNGTNAVMTSRINTPFVAYTSGILVGAACSPNGKVGVDPTGVLYSCVNSFWTSPAGSAVLCTHGSWVSGASNYAMFNISPACKTLTVVTGIGGGGGGGASGAASSTSSAAGGGGGKAATVYANSTFNLTSTGSIYTFIVGAGGGSGLPGYSTFIEDQNHVVIASLPGGAAGVTGGGGAPGHWVTRTTMSAGFNGPNGAMNGGAGGAGAATCYRRTLRRYGHRYKLYTTTYPPAGGGGGGDGNGTYYGGGMGGAGGNKQTTAPVSTCPNGSPGANGGGTSNGYLSVYW